MTLTELKQKAPTLYAFLMRLKAEGIRGKLRNVRIKQ